MVVAFWIINEDKNNVELLSDKIKLAGSIESLVEFSST